MKRALFVFLAVLLLFSLFSCALFPSDKPEEESAGDTSASEQEQDSGKTDSVKTAYETIAEKAEDDPRYRWIKLFLDRDARGCADFLRGESPETWDENETHYEEWFSVLQLLEFGEYSAETVKQTADAGYADEFVRFTFEIADSGYDLFPAGEYTYEIRDDMNSPASWKRVVQTPVELSEHASVLLDYICVCLWSEDALEDMSPQVAYRLLETLFARQTYLAGGESLTEAEIDSAAAQLFGWKEMDLPLDYLDEENGRYAMLPHGGSGASYEVISAQESGEETVITVQFFAEPQCIVKSHLVRYTFGHTDDAFGYCVKNVERLEEGNGTPYIWAV